MSEINQEVGTNQEQVLKKLQTCFAGKIVRKDLTKKIGIVNNSSVKARKEFSKPL